jgi:predicted nucleic acid-binding protein
LPEFWLDANVFIESKKQAYAFDIAPGFWELLDNKAREGVVATSSIVYQELVEKTDDELAAWVRSRKDIGLFIEPDRSVQAVYSTIADYVNQTYALVEASRFLAGADAWLVAHAKAKGGTVVTLETLVPPESRRAKIPNVCRSFDVPYCNTYSMLRVLGVSFGWSAP